MPNTVVLTEEMFNEMLVRLQTQQNPRNNRLYPYGIYIRMAPGERFTWVKPVMTTCRSRPLVLGVDEEFVTLEEARIKSIIYTQDSIPGRAFSPRGPAELDPFLGKLFVPGEEAMLTFENQSGSSVRLRGAWIVETIVGAFE